MELTAGLGGLRGRHRPLGGRHLVVVLAAALVGLAVLVGPGAAPVAAASSSSWWQPPLGNQPWQWELSHPLRLNNAKDMGTNDKLPDGAPAPAPVIYDIDGIVNPASTVKALHLMGKRVVCYVEVGAAGNYYSAAQEGIPVTYYQQLEPEFGAKVRGYPEYYLDIEKPQTLSIIESMIDRQCAAKGFDAVETDIDEEFNDNPGFALTESDEEAYMTDIADYIHSLGMAWWIKNPDDIDNASYADAMYPLVDAVLTEQCNQFDTCRYLSEYVGHKAVFNAEYRLKPARFCSNDDALGFNGARFNLGLTGVRRPCL